MKEQGIRLKKKYSQNFLKDTRYINSIINAVDLNSESFVFEVGGGAGVLTKAILQQPLESLWVFEIDSEWAAELKKISDKRLTVLEENFLDFDFQRFDKSKAWTLLANLPYQITFPILYRLQKNRSLIKEGVIMVQEEVAQKILKKRGRDYGFASLFFQWFFDWKLLDKVPPEAFFPKPKVFSRLLYFKPKEVIPLIERESEFWDFVKVCFKQPRRTLRNNLMQAHYECTNIDPEVMGLRAQQLSMDDFLRLWQQIA